MGPKGMRVYPMFPRAKRLLRVMLAVYALVALLCAFKLWHAHLSLAAMVWSAYGLLALVGIGLGVHFYVYVSDPQPTKDTTPAYRNSGPRDSVYLTGYWNERRKAWIDGEVLPFYVTVPVIIMVVAPCLPALLVLGCLLTLIDKATTNYKKWFQVRKPIRVLLGIYGVLFGISFVGQLNTHNFTLQHILLMLGAVCVCGGLTALLVDLFLLAKTEDEAHEESSSVGDSIKIVTYTWKFRMHGPLFVCVAPLGLFMLAVGIMPLLALVR